MALFVLQYNDFDALGTHTGVNGVAKEDRGAGLGLICAGNIDSDKVVTNQGCWEKI